RGGADAVVGQIQVQVDPVPGDEFVIVLGLGQFGGAPPPCGEVEHRVTFDPQTRAVDGGEACPARVHAVSVLLRVHIARLERIDRSVEATHPGCAAHVSVGLSWSAPEPFHAFDPCGQLQVYAHA